MTAVGRARRTRGYVSGAGAGYAADDAPRVDGYLTAAATRMAVRAGVRPAFAKAAQLPAELSGREPDDDPIRRATHQAAQAATATRPQRGDAARFARAQGRVEDHNDAGEVNTTGGWRDVTESRRKKVTLQRAARRQPAGEASPAG